MFNTRTQRVVFASGILFVLTLAIFGSLIAVAWMSMNNTMAVSADSYEYDFAAEDEFALASRLGDDAPVLYSRLGNDVPMLDSRIDPGIVTSVDISDAVVMVKSRLDPGDVPILHSRIDSSDVPILHSRLGNDVPVLDSRIDSSDVPVLHRQLDPGMFRSVDYKDAVLRIDYKEYVRSMDFKYTVSSPDASDSGPTSDYNSLWYMIRLTH